MADLITLIKYVTKFSLLGLVVLVIAGLVQLYTITTKIVTASAISSVTIGQEVKVQGIVFSTGLSQAEMKTLNLNNATLQISGIDKTDPYFQQIPRPNIDGLYLENSNQYAKFLGKCVKATGVIRKDWNNFNTAYSRSPLIVTSIEETDTAAGCYKTHKESTKINAPQTISGIITRAARPAPDINYDYELALNNPVTMSSGAGDNRPVYKIVITPASNEVWEKMEKLVNLQAEVTGEFRWGYSETQYFYTTDVSP